MSEFPTSAVGLPKELQFSLPPSMGDSCRSYSISQPPDGITTVTGPSLAAVTPFVANSTGAFGSYTPQMISFSPPCGMSPSVFADPNCTTVSFTMSYPVTTAGVLNSGVTGATLQLIGSGASWFDQLVVYSNNTPVETVNQYGLLQNYLLNTTCNQAERFGGVSIAMGGDNNSFNGVNLGCTAITTYKYNFCIPLISILGLNTDKLIPIGSLNQLQVQLTTANLTPIVSYCSALTGMTQPVIGAITLDNFSLNMKYIDVGDIAAAMLRQTLQDGKWFIKSCTYTNSSQTIPLGSNGALQMLLQIRNSSVKSVLHQFGIAPGATCPNGLYDAIGVATSSRQLQVGGQFYPNKPINDINRPAEGYIYLMQALGNSIPKSMGTVVDRSSYNCHYLSAVPATAIPGCDSSITYLPGTGVRQVPAGGDDTTNIILARWPCMSYYGYDIEKVGGILFSGVNTRAAPPFINLYLAAAAQANISLQAWGMSDVVLVVDTVSKQLTSFI